MIPCGIRKVEVMCDPQKSLQLVCILGAGLLCGTALAIVIPEGVSLLEESYRGEDSHLYQITQLTTLSSLEYHPSFILSGQPPPLPPPPLLPHHRVRTPVTPQIRPLQLGSSSDWL